MNEASCKSSSLMGHVRKEAEHIRSDMLMTSFSQLSLSRSHCLTGPLSGVAVTLISLIESAVVWYCNGDAL